MQAILKSQQTLIDLAIQHCGDPEACFDLAMLNGLSITDLPATGANLITPPVIDSRVVSWFISEEIEPASNISDGITAVGIGQMVINVNFIIR